VRLVFEPPSLRLNSVAVQGSRGDVIGNASVRQFPDLKSVEMRQKQGFFAVEGSKSLVLQRFMVNI